MSNVFTFCYHKLPNQGGCCCLFYFIFLHQFWPLGEKKNGRAHPQRMLLEQMAQSCHILRGKKKTEIIMLAKPGHSFTSIDLWVMLSWDLLCFHLLTFGPYLGGELCPRALFLSVDPKNALLGFCAFQASRSASFESPFFIRLTSGSCLVGNHYCILPLAFGSCLGGRLCPRALFLSLEPKAHF